MYQYVDSRETVTKMFISGICESTTEESIRKTFCNITFLKCVVKEFL